MGCSLRFVPTSPITLDFGRHTLRGLATYLPTGRRVLVEVESLGGASLTDRAAAGALASAVRDGRCTVSDEIRAAIDLGAVVAPVLL